LQQPTFQCPDFEDAVPRAVTAVFGRHINHQGCFYHLTQASWRQIQQLGLVPLYKNDSTDSSFFLLTPLDDTPYRRMGMSYQVEEIVVPALAHVGGSGITRLNHQY
jgi:hypothetical protein